MMCLHMEGHFGSVTEMCEGYTDVSKTKIHASYMSNIVKILNLKFTTTLSTPSHGVVDQDWRSKFHVPYAGPPEHAQLVCQEVPLNPR